MGGIFGAVCRDRIPREALFEGLKRLLYRGYDGAGVAFLDEEGKLVVRKAVGHLLRVADAIGVHEVPSRVALGHTRYASRGWPSYENTHPLLDCASEIAVVGDGFIENYEEHRESLKKRGHSFKSTTDTEVYAHFLEELVKQGKGLMESLVATARKLHGVYAIAFLAAGSEKIYAVQRGQPVVIGMGRDCLFVSSDIPSLYGFAEEALVLEENMAVEVGLDGIRVVDIASGNEVSLGEVVRKRVKYPVEVVGKAGYPHFMLKEILEIPDAMIRTTYSIMEKYLRLAAMILFGAKNVYVIANGTSLYAGFVSSYYFADLAGVNVSVVSAAEFPYYVLENVSTGTVIVAVSQSGETSDVINSIKLAKRQGAVIVGITNVVGSRLTIESNVYLLMGAGPEIAVPATKTFVSTLIALALLAGYTGLFTGRTSQDEYRELVESIRNHAHLLKKEISNYSRRAEDIAKTLTSWSSLYLASSGINYPVVLEGALKFKEAAIVHAEGMQLGELRHGPMVLIAGGMPVIVVKPIEAEAISLYEKVSKEILARNGKLITITQDGEGYGEVFRVAESTRVLSPVTTIIPLQLIAYYLGVKLGRPIDTPPGLAKAITT